MIRLGSLVAWASGPGIVLTTQPKVVQILNDLAADPRNIVYVMSGETTFVYPRVCVLIARPWKSSLDRARTLV